MSRLRKLIEEALTIPPKKNCDCGGACCSTEITAPILKDNKFVYTSISEGLQYHIDNKIPLSNNIYRVGTKEYMELYKEARSLYSRNRLNVSEEDKYILTETNIGDFGIFEGKKVPLGIPMLNEGYDAYDEIAQAEFSMDYDQLGPNEQEWVRDEYDKQPSGRDSIKENIDIYDFLKKNREQIILDFGPQTYRTLQIQLMKDDEAWVRNWLVNKGYIDEEKLPFEEGKLTEAPKNGDILYLGKRKGKVIKVMADMANVDFGKGDVYGITFSRIKGNKISEGKMNESVIGVKTDRSFKPAILTKALDKAKIKYKFNRLSMTLSVLDLDKKYFETAKKIVDALGLNVMMATEVKIKTINEGKLTEDRKAKEYIKSIKDKDEREDERKRMFDDEMENEATDEELKTEYDNILSREADLTRIYQNDRTEENWERLSLFRQKGRNLEKKLAKMGLIDSYLAEIIEGKPKAYCIYIKEGNKIKQLGYLNEDFKKGDKVKYIGKRMWRSNLDPKKIYNVQDVVQDGKGGLTIIVNQYPVKAKDLKLAEDKINFSKKEMTKLHKDGTIKKGGNKYTFTNEGKSLVESINGMDFSDHDLGDIVDKVRQIKAYQRSARQPFLDAERKIQIQLASLLKKMNAEIKRRMKVDEGKVNEGKNSNVNFVKRLLQSLDMGMGTKPLSDYQISVIIEALFRHKIIQ